MKIAIASDHAGFKTKETIAAFLKSENLQFTDFGTSSEDSVDYPDFAKKVAGRFRQGCRYGHPRLRERNRDGHGRQ